MPYSEFSLASVCEAFSLTVQEPLNLFADAPQVLPIALLQTILDQNTRLAGGANKEKAKSELIVSPVLLEVYRIFNSDIGYFSGAEFNVDPALKLTSYCNFLLTATPGVAEIRTPVVTVVEAGCLRGMHPPENLLAKNDDIPSGFGQCAAEMVAAQLKNQKEDRAVASILGVVTTGNDWKFLQPSETTLLIDRRDYFIVELPQILGILVEQIQQARG